MIKHKVVIDWERCVGCGLCAGDCAANNIELKDGKARVLMETCIFCGHCAAVCPREAVAITGYGEQALPKERDFRLDPDEVLEVIRYRRTIRQFKDQDIPREVMDQILEAGRLTHTAKNAQDLSFAVLREEKDRVEAMAVGLFRKVKPLADLFSPMARNAKIDDGFFFFGAPAVVAVLAKDKINGHLAAQNMEFVAEANGLGVLYSGFFATAARFSPRIRKALGATGGRKVAAVLVLGYPKVKYLRSAQREKLNVRYM